MRTIAFACLAILLGGSSPALANLSDPVLSSCDFPQSNLLCTDPLVIPITAIGSGGVCDSALVEVLIEVDSGSLDSGQLLLTQAFTNSLGEAFPEFPSGINGNGVIYFRVFANGILICVSNTYVVDACPTPVQPVSWGELKRVFGFLGAPSSR
jgi:hypothetical protein